MTAGIGILSKNFTKTNEPNLSLQAYSISTFSAEDRIASFQSRLEIWIKDANTRNLNDSFGTGSGLFAFYY
jgi:hypothetical protein